MITLQTHIRNLQSVHSATRLYAAEELLGARGSSPEVIYALEKAACDDNAQVAETARAALRREVHHAMAVKMGRASKWMLKVNNRR